MMMTSNTAPRTDHLAYCKCKNDGKRSKCRCGEDRNGKEYTLLINLKVLNKAK